MTFAPQHETKSVSEYRNVSVSFSGKLDSGELLTGTPTVVVASPSVSPEDLILSSKIVNTSELAINGVTVPIGEAVQFHVTGGSVANSPYTIRIMCSTDATPSQNLIGNIILHIEDD